MSVVGKVEKNIDQSNLCKFEQDYGQNDTTAYEVEKGCQYIQFVEHAGPSSLIRSHHYGYELHLISDTTGRAYIGDYIGEFKPGNLVLVGPHLPYNWVSKNASNEGFEASDKILQFTDKPLRQTSFIFPELHELMPLLERAKFGIEFEGITDVAEASLDKIRDLSGINRLTEFLQLLHTLSTHQDYRLLSSTHYHNLKTGSYIYRVEKAIGYIALNYESPLSMKEVAQHANMTVNSFSRDFRRATGKTFTSYMNHLRVTRACELLISTELYVSTICYKVGFSNVANFNRRFMGITGVTPSEFRRERTARFD